MFFGMWVRYLTLEWRCSTCARRQDTEKGVMHCTLHRPAYQAKVGNSGTLGTHPYFPVCGNGAAAHLALLPPLTEGTG